MGPIAIAGLTCSEFVVQARERLPRGHGFATQVYQRALATGTLSLSGLGAAAETEAYYHEHFCMALPQVGQLVTEEGPLGVTAKVSLRSPDGLEYETVFLPMGRGRSTLCISSQVGCKMGCTFCETGRMGLIRQLTAAEIVGQLLLARTQLGFDFRNVVFMGMGEALDNVDSVVQALRVMTDSAGLSIGQERITVCTVGHVAGLAKLGEAGFKRLNLSVSLNAATDRLRSEMMPVNRRTPLSNLQEALLRYRPRDNFALGVNYCLLPDINDSSEDALRIADFCRPLGRVMVNLIPYNPGSDPITRAPTEEEIVAFIGHIRAAGLPVRRRITKGRTVMAACGQLGNVDLRKQVRAQRREVHERS